MTINISNSQLKLLQPVAINNYVTELIEHCRENFPHLEKTMGEEKLSKVLLECVNKAKLSGFDQRGSVKFYIEMLIIFGFGFEADPQYVWIRDSLKKNIDFSQLIQTQTLHFEVEQYLDSIMGEKNKYLFTVAEKLEKLTLDRLIIKRENYVENVHLFLNEIYPEKYLATDKQGITALIKQGASKAYYDYGFEEANQATLIVLLMFLLGHQFDHDPFYEWASLEKTMSYRKSSNKIDVLTIAEKLETRAKIWLTATVKNEWPITS